MFGVADGPKEERAERRRERTRPSRWQDADPAEAALTQQKPAPVFASDRDMRFAGNGDVDMRTIVPQLVPMSQSNHDCDIDIRSLTTQVRAAV